MFCYNSPLMMHIRASLSSLPVRLSAFLRSLLVGWLNRSVWAERLLVLSLSDEMLDILRELAEREGRSPHEAAGHLLGLALFQRQAADEKLRTWRDLSPREREVAALVTLGYTNREIAARLVLSVETVKTHIQHIQYKFRVKRKHDLRIALAEWDFRAWDVSEPGAAGKPPNEGNPYPQ